MSSALASRRLSSFVDHHGADAVVREHFQQQRAVLREGQDVRALDAAAAGLDAVAQVEGRVAGLGGRGQRGQQPLGVGQRELGVDRALRVVGLLVDAGDLGDEEQLVGLQRHGGAGRHVFHRQVEGLAGGREAEGREQHQRAGVDGLAHRGRIDLAHHAAVHEVDAVDDADRPRGQEVARHHAHDRVGHRRVGQALRERGLDLEAQLAGGLLAQSSATASVMRMPWL